MKGCEDDRCKKEKRRKRKLKESQSGQKFILIKEIEIISVKNQDSEAVKMKGSEHDCKNKEKRRKRRKLKESESGGNLKKRRRNRAEEEQEVNTENPKHDNVVKVDERKSMEASMAEKNDDDMKMGIEDVDGIQSSVTVNDKSTSKLKDKRSANGAELVHGKRFTEEEDDIIRKAVLDYVAENQLGDRGVGMVLNSRVHPNLRGCWKEIAEALPHRPRGSINKRAHNIFTRSKRGWTKKEIDSIMEMHEKHGGNWAFMAKKLGRYEIHVREAYLRTKTCWKKGRWSQDEYQTLFDLVHADLEFKVLSGEKKWLQYGMFRDNIGWKAISDKLGTRHNAWCCSKWYHSLSSRMVVDGTWADADDYRMLIALYKLDSSCEEDVEWDDLMEHRTGECCRMRWKQMVRHIGEHGSKSFSEQVEVLSQRYCSKMLDARVKLDSRPIVD